MVAFSPLKLGVTSPPARAWGAFLHRRKWRTSLSDFRFDAESEAGTRAFQALVGLAVTGEVDSLTWAEGDRWGLGEDGRPIKSSIAPLSMRAREEAFEKFAYQATPQANNPEAITVEKKWVSRNIVTFPVPQLAGVPGLGSQGLVTLHQKARGPFEALVAAWEAAGLLGRITNWGGGWAPRFIRDSKSILSNHAYGTAFDLSTLENGLNTRGAPAGAVGCLFDLVGVAERYGWAWGGFFGRQDPMHFELARV
jgi:hypothetical protein